MNNILHQPFADLQDKDPTANTLARISEINALVDRETVPEGFEVDGEGVWFLIKKQNEPPVRIWICSPLWVTAYTRDHKNENHGRVLEFPDIDGHKHRWTMPMDLLAGEGAKILGALLNMGLRLAPQKKAKDYVLEYIAQCNPVRRARCVLQCGWFNGVFVLPSQTIGYLQKEKITYQNPATIEIRTDAAGTLDDWKDKVAKKACGNSRLILSISAAFTGPLLDLLNHENIGIHYRGNSSLGKSTAMYVGNSVWGNATDMHTFRATANGLEGVASLHNDRLLCLDELGQISPLEAGQVIYMLGNGMGKERATQHGLAKKQITWRLVFLSTGELSLAQLMNEAGKRVKAGQEVRFIEIPADTGIHGLFENLHEFDGGSDFSTYLRDTCAHFHGTASKAFLERLVEDSIGAVDMIKTIINGIQHRFLPQDASAQVIRVFNHLALIAAAGELASQFGITGWETEEAITGIMKCFNDWLRSRGDSGMQEEGVAISQVRKFFEQHAESRFSKWDADPMENRTINRAGFKRQMEDEIEFYVFPETFKTEICSGLDHSFVAKVCIRHGLLKASTDGSPTRAERLPCNSNGTARCYRFTSKVIEG